VEQYHEDENTVVVKVWEDFCRKHWPELYQSSVSSGDEDSRNTSSSTTTSSAGPSSYGTSSRSKNDDRPRTEQTAHRNTADLVDLKAPKKRSLVGRAR
jgi:hypothetical protein